MDPRPGKHPEQSKDNQDILYLQTSTFIQTHNTGVLGHLLKTTQKSFNMDHWQPQRMSKNPQDTIDGFSEKYDTEFEWLRSLLETAVNTYDEESALGSRAFNLIEASRSYYNQNSLDSKKRAILERIHEFQEYFARGIIAFDRKALENFGNFIGIFQAFDDSQKHTALFLNSVCFASLQIMGDSTETKLLIKHQNSADVALDEKKVLDYSENLGEYFDGYTNALVDQTAIIHMVMVLQQFAKNESITQDDYKRLMQGIFIPLETNLEAKKGFGVGINIFEDPRSYIPPDSQQIDKAFDVLTKIKTNTIPGGSEEVPIDYQTQLTEGLKLRDVWNINTIHIVGKHAIPILKDSPLYLHIAMERASKQPPLYAFFNIRSNQLCLVIPDGLDVGGTAELHLQLYALLTDLRHIQRSGVSIQDEAEYQPNPIDKLKIPLKRSFVVGTEGIREVPKLEPACTVYVTPREATLPYGSKYMLAIRELNKAQAENDNEKIEKAQKEVDRIANRLPVANNVNLKKYEQKAAALGLDSGTIRIRNGRIYTAPKQGYDQPVFTEFQTTRLVIPQFGANILKINELLSTIEAPEALEETPQPEIDETQQMPTQGRSLLRRMQFWKRD